MSIAPAILDAMVASGCTAEQIAAVVKADIASDDARKEAKRANNAERQRRYRDKNNADNALQASHNADNGDPPLSRPPNEINSNPPTHTPVNIPRTRKGWPIPNGVSAEQWEAFCRQRKKALNPRAYELLTGKLMALARDGWPPGDMIDLAIERGWETVFEPKDYRNGHRPTGPDPLAAALQAARAAEDQDNDPGTRLALSPEWPN